MKGVPKFPDHVDHPQQATNEEHPGQWVQPYVWCVVLCIWASVCLFCVCCVYVSVCCVC